MTDVINRLGAPLYVVGLIGPPCSGVSTLARGIAELHDGVSVLESVADLEGRITELRAHGKEWVILDGAPPTTDSLMELIETQVVWPFGCIIRVECDDEFCMRRGASELGLTFARKAQTELLHAARAKLVPTFGIGAGDGEAALRGSLFLLARLMGYK